MSVLKTACIIAAGEWGGSRALLKNRDRNYQPKLKIYHEVRNGQEVLYLKDEGTGWVEGLNASGIGVVNSALLVARDEAEKKIVKTEGKKSKDGPRLLRILEQKTLEGAVKEVLSFKNGLMGHTFVSDAKKAFSIEQTSKHKGVSKALTPKKLHVRTNHGFHYEDAGYAATSEAKNYHSSVARRNQAKKVLQGLASPGEIGPSLYRKRKKDLKDPTNMVRDTKNMRTSSQVVLDLGKLRLLLYLIPGKVTYQGYVNKLPKGFKPKLSLEVYEYTDLDDDGDFDVALRKEDKKATLSLRVLCRYRQASLPERVAQRYRQASLRDTLQAEFPGVNLWVEESPSRKLVILHKIVVPKEVRGQGLGAQVMKRLLRWADGKGWTVSVTPSSDFGGSVPRLTRFYRTLGFVPNKGRRRDDVIYQSMYRLPQ